MSTGVSTPPWHGHAHGRSDGPPSGGVHFKRRTAMPHASQTRPSSEARWRGCWLMRFGTYYFLQRPPGFSDAEVIRTGVDEMVWCDQLGFGSVWLTEHHFADYGISAAPSVLAATVLSRTERLKVGLAVYVLPFHDPIRFAEEVATLDILGNGRLI